MKRMEKVADTMLRPINPTLIIVLGIYTIVWGLWLISPFWTVFTQAAVYSSMHALAPESVWGAVAVSTGMLITRGAIKPSYMNLRIGSFVGFFHWLIIGVLYIAGDWINTGGITCLTFAVYAGLVWLNLKVNRGHFEDYSV